MCFLDHSVWLASTFFVGGTIERLESVG
jgi:hypothetical protein